MGKMNRAVIIILLVLDFFCRESRYLLFLTENYAALQTLQHFLETSHQGQPGVQGKMQESPYVLFGSSFPKDKDYTQVL